MIKMKRPDMIASFAEKTANGEDTEIESLRNQLKQVADKSLIRFGKEVGMFPESWSLVELKQVFARAQSGKCAYCDSKETGSPLHVEHFAPKSVVGELQTNEKGERAVGQEIDDLVNVRGRGIKTKWPSGYWWKAYDWNNYLLACERCNSAWKQTLFPIEETRTGPPDEDTKETQLLLNPFDEDPLEHFNYSDTVFGAVEGRDAKGKATIETCGLDRKSLLLARK